MATPSFYYPTSAPSGFQPPVSEALATHLIAHHKTNFAQVALGRLIFDERKLDRSSIDREGHALLLVEDLSIVRLLGLLGIISLVGAVITVWGAISFESFITAFS